MKSTLIARLTLSAVALVGSVTPILAESHGLLRVSVPFSFTVAGTKMPAGDYSIEQSGEGGTMIFHSLAGKKSVMVLTAPSGYNPSAHGASLTFNRVGGDAVLTSISTESSVRNLSR
jgi:hypothetical protein